MTKKFTYTAVCLLFISLNLIANLPLRAQTSDVVRKAPYLIYDGNHTEMQVRWQLYSAHTCSIEWGTDGTYSEGNAQTSEYGDDHQHSYTIPDLIFGKVYFYRVSVSGETYQGTFRSAPDPDDKSVNFFVYGDTRSQPEVHDEVVAGMLAAGREDEALRTIILAVGDLVSEGDTESLWDEDFFNPIYSNIQEMLASLPYQSCMGNHERDGILYTKYFPYPFEAGRYWSFDYGPAHFIVVDQYTDYGSGSVQLNWIENDLATSTKAWKFIILHEPGWTTGNHGNDSDVQTYIQPLCEKYNVHVVFGGHNHLYARALVNNVFHITTGGGGAPLYDPDPGSPNIVTSAKAYHFCKVEIKGRHLTITAIDEGGNIVDSFSIEDQTLPVKFSINPSDTLDFGDVFTGFKDTLRLTLENTGYDVVQISHVSISGEGFLALTDTLHMEMGDSAFIPVVFSPLTEGSYFGSASVSSNDSDDPLKIIQLSGKGIHPPDISLTPDALKESMATGDTARQVLTISNLGSKDLLFGISAADQSQNNLQVPLPGWLQIDTLSGNIPPFSKMEIGVTFDAAGLDTGRYTAEIMIVSNDPFEQEVYLPAELTVYGIPELSLSDTLVQFRNVSLGSPATDTLIISNRGSALLSISDISSDNKSFRTDTSFLSLLPNEGYYLQVIFGADSLGSSSGGLSIRSNDPGNPEIVVDLLGETVLPPRITVIPDSLTEFLTIGDTSRRLLSVTNQGAKELLFEISSADQSLNNTPSALPGWLQLDTLSGRIPPFSKMDIGITFDAAGLDTGRYSAEIIISSNDTHQPELLLPALLHVSGFPDITVSDTLLLFENIVLGASLTDTLIISNTGIEPLRINEIVVSHPAFATDTSAFTLLPGENYHLSVTFSADTTGLRLALLTIRSNDPDEEYFNVSLKGSTLKPASIIVSPAALHDSLETGQSVSEFMTISNAGESPLIFYLWCGITYPDRLGDSTIAAVSQGDSTDVDIWLSASPDSGIVPAGDSLVIHIDGDLTGLGTGEFEASIVVYSNDPINNEISIPVYIKVIPSGTEDPFNLMIPKTFELLQNYPNPFNPVTRIRYGIPKAGDVKIDIYNVIGQLITTLLDEKETAGYHQVEFDAQNLPSGIYLYLFKSGSYQEAKKMLLIK